MARLRLIGSRILIKPLHQATKSEGGIHLAENFQDDRTRWEVIDTGPKVPPEIKPGCKILTRGMDSLYEFTDKVQIIEANEVVMVW